MHVITDYEFESKQGGYMRFAGTKGQGEML